MSDKTVMVVAASAVRRPLGYATLDTVTDVPVESILQVAGGWEVTFADLLTEEVQADVLTLLASRDDTDADARAAITAAVLDVEANPPCECSLLLIALARYVLNN